MNEEESQEAALRASLQAGVDDIVAAVGDYRASQRRSHLAAVATIAFSFVELLDGAPPEMETGLAVSAAAWFRAAAEAWERPELFDMAVELGRRGVAAAQAEDRVLASALATLGQSLTDSWEAGGGEERLGEAIEVLRRAAAVAERDPDDPDRPQVLNALGVALLEAEVAGLDVSLKETVGVFERAIALSPPDSSEVLGHLGNLSGAMRRLAERTGQQAYLDQAITQFEEAIGRVGATDDTGLIGALYNGMAIALHDRFTLDRREKTLDEAIAAQRLAVAQAPPSVWRQALGRKNNLAGYLVEKFAEGEDRDVLEEGVGLLEEVYELTGREDPEFYGAAQNLANALHTRGVADEDLKDLRRALELRCEASDVAPTNPYLAGMKHGLATTLRRIQELDPSASCEDEVDGLLEEALRLGATADPVGAIKAGRELLRERIARGDFLAAVEAGEEGLELARRASLQQVGLESRRQVLRELRGIASRTAMAAATAGEVERAVLALESGQAVVFGEQIELAAIAAAAGPELAGRIAPLREALGSVDPLPPRRRLEAREALDAAIGEAGGELGRRPDWAGVLEAAAVRPLLYLAAGPAEGLAILVTPADGARPFECPGLVEGRIEELTAAYFEAIEALRAEVPDLDKADQRLEEVAAGLGQALPEALHDVLADLPEVAVIGSDYLSTLPLHLIDRGGSGSARHTPKATITAVPSAGALRWAARQRVGEGLEPRVVVAVTTGPRAAPGADLEVRLALAHGPARVLGERADAAEVLAAAAEARYLHIACHGLSDPRDSYKSHLVLAAGDLRAADFLAAAPGDGRLALLSACETAVGEIALPDEGGGLANALLQFGYGGVIGTSWPVPGDVAAYFADALNRRLLDAGDKPVAAHRDAVAEVAALSAGELRDWFDGESSARALRTVGGAAGDGGSELGAAADTLPLRLCEWGAFRYSGW